MMTFELVQWKRAVKQQQRTRQKTHIQKQMNLEGLFEVGDHQSDVSTHLGGGVLICQRGGRQEALKN